jgi:hypothetical protein
MRSTTSLLLSLLAAAALAQASAAEPTTVPAAAGMSATQIVERHVAARGGIKAWHSVQTLAVSGKMDAGRGDSLQRSITMARQGVGVSVKHAEREAAAKAAQADASNQVQLPFRLEMKRPNKSRLEIDFDGKTAVQVFDGQNGWKLRPYLNRDDAEPFSSEEVRAQQNQADLEPPLVDYAAKGSQVALEGTDKVDGHNAYRLKLTLKDGTVRHVWIDAQSFLDVKVEGAPRRMDGTMRAVWIYQRDFKSIQGVKVPYLYETTHQGSPQSHRMVIETVTVNPALADARFSKPNVLVAGSPGPNPPASPPPAKK